MWEHHAHMLQLYVRAGQVVRRGDVIGVVGKTGNATGPHDHFEIHKQDPKIRGYRAYSNGLSRNQVLALYADPMPYVHDGIPLSGFGFGYRFLQTTKDGKIHPGSDLAIAQGIPIRCVFNGVVDFAEYNAGGWGWHCYIRETNQGESEDMYDKGVTLQALQPGNFYDKPVTNSKVNASYGPGDLMEVDQVGSGNWLVAAAAGVKYGWVEKNKFKAVPRGDFDKLLKENGELKTKLQQCQSGDAQKAVLQIKEIVKNF